MGEFCQPGTGWPNRRVGRWRERGRGKVLFVGRNAEQRRAMKFLALLSALTLPMVSAFAANDDTRVFEMRTYYAAPGKLDALNARFRDHTCKLFEKHGMTNVGYWMPIENPDNKLIYVLAYPNRDAREKSWKAFM